MERVSWFFAIMAAWSFVTLTPGALLRKRPGGKGMRIASGVLIVVGMLGLAVLIAILMTAYVRGTRLPWVGGKGPDL